jgi:hypothetical protein
MSAMETLGRWHHHDCLLVDRRHPGPCIVPPEADPLVPAQEPVWAPTPAPEPRSPRGSRPGHAGRVLARRDRLVRRWLDRTGERWTEALRGGAAAKHARWEASMRACPPCVKPTLSPSVGASNPERRTGMPKRWRDAPPAAR